MYHRCPFEVRNPALSRCIISSLFKLFSVAWGFLWNFYDPAKPNSVTCTKYRLATSLNEQCLLDWLIDSLVVEITYYFFESFEKPNEIVIHICISPPIPDLSPNSNRLSLIFTTFDLNAPRASQETLSTAASQTSIVYNSPSSPRIPQLPVSTELDESYGFFSVNAGYVSRTGTMDPSNRLPPD